MFDNPAVFVHPRTVFRAGRVFGRVAERGEGGRHDGRHDRTRSRSPAAPPTSASSPSERNAGRRRSDSMTPTIEAVGLSKRFGKTVALDGLDLVAEPGQVLAVLGPNGAGKTTFVRAVATL